MPNKTIIRVIALLGSIIVPDIPSHADTLPYWNIRYEQLECVKSHLDDYLASPNENIVIFLRACPETDFSKIIAMSTKNSALPEVEKKDQSDNAAVEVISIGRTQLRCLAKFLPPSPSEIVQVPKNLCN